MSLTFSIQAPLGIFSPMRDSCSEEALVEAASKSTRPLYARRPSSSNASKGTRWLVIASLGLLLCARTCEGSVAVKRLGGASGAQTEPEPAKHVAERSSRLVRSHVNSKSEAVIQETSTSDSTWPIKPHVVQIFYEALCPDSARLISDRKGGLWSSYNQRKHNYRFDLYPYGNAYKDHWNQTICQHGSEECKGNLVHQCALKMLNTTQAFATIDCLMDVAARRIAQLKAHKEGSAMNGAMMQADGSWVYNKAPKREYIIYKEDVADVCWKKLHQPQWKDLVEKCIFDGEMSWNVANYFATETKRVNFSWVPAVFFNGTYNNKASHDTDLLSYLS